MRIPEFKSKSSQGRMVKTIYRQLNRYSQHPCTQMKEPIRFSTLGLQTGFGTLQEIVSWSQVYIPSHCNKKMNLYRLLCLWNECECRCKLNLAAFDLKTWIFVKPLPNLFFRAEDSRVKVSSRIEPLRWEAVRDEFQFVDELLHGTRRFLRSNWNRPWGGPFTPLQTWTQLWWRSGWPHTETTENTATTFPALKAASANTLQKEKRKRRRKNNGAASAQTNPVHLRVQNTTKSPFPPAVKTTDTGFCAFKGGFAPKATSCSCSVVQ